MVYPNVAVLSACGEAAPVWVEGNRIDGAKVPPDRANLLHENLCHTNTQPASTRPLVTAYLASSAAEGRQCTQQSQVNTISLLSGCSIDYMREASLHLVEET